MPWEFDRNSYRIPYPPSASGTITIDKREVPLIDVSERGIRYLVSEGVLPEVGGTIEGSVRLLSNRQAIAVTGTVVRCHDGAVAIALDAPGLPMQALFAEQRFLARRFPARYRSAAGT